MKKLIFPILICFFALTTSANSLINPSTEKITIALSYEVNTFCKLIQMGNYEAVKALIDAGEDVNKKSNGMTPLMFAARHNKAEIAKLLIKHGAKLKVKCERTKLTALDMAKRSKAVDAIKVLKEALDK